VPSVKIFDRTHVERKRFVSNETLNRASLMPPLLKVFTSSENAAIFIVLVLADVAVRLIVPAGPSVPGPNNALPQFYPHLTFSVMVKF